MLDLEKITELRRNFWMVEAILGKNYVAEQIGNKPPHLLIGLDMDCLLMGSDVKFYVPQNMKGYILSTIRGQWSEYGPPFTEISVYDAVQKYPLAVLTKAVEKCIAKVTTNE